MFSFGSGGTSIGGSFASDSLRNSPVSFGGSITQGNMSTGDVTQSGNVSSEGGTSKQDAKVKVEIPGMGGGDGEAGGIPSIPGMGLVLLQELGDNHVTNYYAGGTTNVKGILGNGGRNTIDNFSALNGSSINIGGFLQELGDNHVTNYYAGGTTNVKGILGNGGRNTIDNFSALDGSSINIGGFLQDLKMMYRYPVCHYADRRLCPMY